MNSTIQKFEFALKGIKTAFSEEAHLRFHTIAAIIVILFGFYFDLSTIEWLIIVVCIGGVIAFELINSAIESLVDLKSPEQHPIAGKVKDISAGAVLIISIASAIAGSLIFWPHICSVLF